MRELLYGAATHDRPHQRPDRCQHLATRSALRMIHLAHESIHRWKEYVAAELGGCRYSRFCELYRD